MKSSFTSSRPRRRARAGFTLVEVMMAVAIITAGAVGIMALQKAALVSNLEARKITTANAVLRTWMERLKRDSINWSVGKSATTVSNHANSTYLGGVPNFGTPGAWALPAVVVTPDGTIQSHAFNQYGIDVQPGDPSEIFCAQYRLQFVDDGQTMRADVRVWWDSEVHQGMGFVSAYAAHPNCGLGAFGDNTVNIHSVAASTLLRWTARPQ